LKRKMLIAPVLALVLLVPGTPAPTRAGTFEVVIPTPALALIEANASFTQITAAACLGLDGVSPWLAVTAVNNQFDQGYTGTSATVKDKPDKLKATFRDKAKDAASEEIHFVDVDASTDPDTGTAEGVKAGMKGKIAKYVVNPDPQNLPLDLAVTSGKLKVKDKTNKTKLTIDANGAFKSTIKGGSCRLEFDETGKAVSARIDGLAGGKSIRLGSG
jgi:hypothetical protein